MDAFRLRHDPFGYEFGYSNSPAIRTPSGYTGSLQGSPAFSGGQPSPGDRATSVATTPLSSFSNHVANAIDYPIQPLPFPPPIPSTPLDIRPYNPAKVKKSGEGFNKSCVPCHLKKRKCLPKSGTSTCNACSGKALYCRGVINLVDLVDIAQLSLQAVESLRLQREALASVASTCSTVELSIQANLELPERSPDPDFSAISAGIAESYELPLEDGLFPRNKGARQKMARIFDLVLPTLKPPTARGDTVQELNLAEYEVCCRRLIASITILGNLGASSLGRKACKNSVTPYIVLGFMAHVGEEIRCLLDDLATQLNRFLCAPRNPRYFTSRVWMVAFSLGRVYSAVESANSAWRVHQQVIPIIGNIFSNAEALLVQLKSIGCGLYKDSFWLGTGDQIPHLMGVRLQLHEALTIGSPRWSSSTRMSEQSFDTFENILSQCSPRWGRINSRYRSKAAVTFHLEAESSDDDSIPGNDILDKNMGSPMLEASYTPFTTEQTAALLSEMKQEILQLQGQVRDKQEKRDEIDNQLARDQARIEQLQASIDLAALCELPADSPKKTILASTMPTQSCSSSLARDMHPDSAELTFSPSDQTLVEMGQIAAVEGANLAFTQNQDVMMITEMESPAINPKTSDASDSDSQISNRSLWPSPRRHGIISSRKRRRLSGLFSADLPEDADPLPETTSHGIPLASGPIGEQLSPGQCSNPVTLRGRSRRSQHFSGLPPVLGRTGTHESDSPRVESARPVSFPQSQRWRKSLGVSVKTLTEGFERMRLKQKESKTTQAP